MIIKGLAIILFLCVLSLQNQAKAETEIGEINIPQIPPELEDGEDRDAWPASSLLFLWRIRLSLLEKETPGYIASETQPKTVVVVDNFQWMKIRLMDAPDPLFAPENADFADKYILQSLSTEDINFDDPKLLTPEGLTIKTMNDKDFTFKKDESTGKIQVNGVEVLSHNVLKGNTNLIITSDFLFNFDDEWKTAFDQLERIPYGPF